MRSLLISIQSEFFKSRKTLAFWAAVLLPLVICGLIALGFYAQSEQILKQKMPPMLLWIRLSTAALGVMGMLILPFYVIFMAFSVNNIEHKNDTWKSLFSQPLNKFSIYTAKYLYGIILIAICLLLFPLITYLSGHLLEMLISEYKFSGFSPVAMLKAFYLKLFFASLGIFSLQFMLSLLWSDFLKPMGIGFVGVIMGIITANVGWKYAKYIPYSHPSLAISSKTIKNPTAGDFPIFTDEVWLSIAFAAVFFIMGYFILSKKNIK